MELLLIVTFVTALQSVILLPSFVGSSETHESFEYRTLPRRNNGSDKNLDKWKVSNEWEYWEPFESQLNKSAHIKGRSLALCKSDNATDDKFAKFYWRVDAEGYSFLEIPAFSAIDIDYGLKWFKIDSTGNVKCTKEEGTAVVVSISKRQFTANIEDADSDISSILRNSTFLIQENLYLSVGIEGRAVYYSPGEYCMEDVSGNGDNIVVAFKICPLSPERPIFRKCCPVGMFIDNDGNCRGIENSLGKNYNFEYLNLDDNMKLVWASEVDAIYTSKLVECSKEKIEPWEEDECTFEFYASTDNGVAFIGAHRKWELLEADSEFCLDKGINGTNIMMYCSGNGTNSQKKKHQARISLIYMISMYVGAAFNGLTTVIYLATWSKQNQHGRILGSCTASLFFMQIFLGTAHLLGKLGNQRNSPICIANGILAQYFMIAAFTWLLVVNVDLWSTFRAIRVDESSKDCTRFLKNSFSGWGFPAVVVFVSIAMQLTFRCRVSGVPVPEYGDHICFVAPWSQGPYVYYILSFLIALSLIFAVLTLIGLYNYKKDTNALRSTRVASDKQKCLISTEPHVFLFLKLGVLMGLTWVFEVVSWATTKEGEVGHVIWLLLDLYNAFSSILIFIIFVCKNSTLELLKGYRKRRLKSFIMGNATTTNGITASTQF